MRILFTLIVAICFNGLLSAQPKPNEHTPTSTEDEKIECQFIGKVLWIKMNDNWEGIAVPIGIDPNWLVAIDILSLEKPFRPFTEKGQAVLLVHSPTLLLADPSNDRLGKTYRFTITGVLRDGKPNYHFAQAFEYRETEQKKSSSQPPRKMYWRNQRSSVRIFSNLLKRKCQKKLPQP